MSARRRVLRMTLLLLLVAVAVACSGGSGGDGSPGERRRGGGGPGGMPWEAGDGGTAAVPVEVATVVRRDVSSYIETNGTLEAENEVDIVARASGPLVELRVEEGDRVDAGQLLARLEQDAIKAQMEISRVNLEESRLSYERAQSLREENLISVEEFERARAAFESAQAQYRGEQIQFGYTEIRAPFAGLIVRRYVDFAQTASVNQALFRISDFTPLLCPIQIPERDLGRLHLGQNAYLTVESFPGERFTARVLRINPVIDAESGTVRVTLEVEGRDRLRPGMFARVYVETETHRDTLVVPKQALSLESIGDTIYVAVGEIAARREVELGFQEGDAVEILAGVEAGESVIVVGQDGLADGTPIRILRRDGETAVPAEAGPPATPDAARGPGGPGGPGGRRGGPGGRPDVSSMTPEQIEQMKQRMRERGMTEEQIKERIGR